MIAPDAEDSLEYFNVYFPYADDRLTLSLDKNPEIRPIAAEFLVRFTDETRSEFNEDLRPMSPWGPVRIGKSLIRYGNPPIEDVEFRYKVERRGNRLWLVLESKLMRLELIKLLNKPGDVKNSNVVAPIKDYSLEHLSQLRERYEKLSADSNVKRGSSRD
jgi:hypothetical protein